MVMETLICSGVDTGCLIHLERAGESSLESEIAEALQSHWCNAKQACMSAVRLGA